MGHQLRFCATPIDTAELQQRFAKLEPMRILHNRSPSREPRVVDSLDFSEGGQRWRHYCLVRASDLGSVLTQHVPAQGHWVVDELRSPTVKCGVSYVAERFMRVGRLYYVDGYYGPAGEWIEKPEPFRRWAGAILRAARRALTKHEDLYIGSDARQYLERDEKFIERM